MLMLKRKLFSITHRALATVTGPIGNDGKLLLPAYLKPFNYEQDYENERKTVQLKAPPNFNFARDVVEKWAEVERQMGEKSLALWWTDDTGDERKFSFTDIVEESKRLANGLSMVAGLKPGDRVVVVLPKLYQWWLLATAMARSNIVMCPGTLMLSERDLQHRMELSGAVAIITDEGRVERVENALKAMGSKSKVKHKILVPTTRDKVSRSGWLPYDELIRTDIPKEHKCVDNNSDDSMMIYFTSGTTGLPKMVDMPHKYSLGHYSTARYLLDARPGDLLWSFSDPGWVKILYMQYMGPWLGRGGVFCWNNTDPNLKPIEMYWYASSLNGNRDLSYVVTDPGWAKILWAFFGSWIHGGANFVRQNHKHVNPATEALQVLKKYPINTLCAAPTLYRMFMLEKLPTPEEIPHLRNCLSAGEPNNPEVIERWKKATGVGIREGYGQSETTLLCCNMPGMPVRPFSMGKATPGSDLRIIDDDLNEVGFEEEGHLALKLPKNPEQRPIGLFKQYIDAPEAMAKSFRGDYYITGDKCYRDKDGYIYFVGRADDVIIMSGYRIGPFEVESALIEHESVAESAVVSSPDKLKGEVVKAFVVLKPGYKDQAGEKLAHELQAHCKKVTAPYKYPRKIEFVDSLPKTVSGKTRRVELRQREWADYNKTHAHKHP